MALFRRTVAELLSVTHRNGLRLQKLVNTLLDFSRIEAGRVQASYEPTDLAAFTAELASDVSIRHGEGRAAVHRGMSAARRASEC